MMCNKSPDYPQLFGLRKINELRRGNFRQDFMGRT